VVCAVLGGTILVIQFVLTLIGLGGDTFHIEVPHDVGHDFGGDFAHEVGGDVHGDAAGGEVHAEAGAHEHGDASVHHEHQGDAGHHGTAWFFRVLSFRTVVAAMAFFGLAGLAADSAEATKSMSLLVAVGAGLIAMYAVYWMMQKIYSLKSEGTVRIDRAVGLQGTVYLTIPAQESGTGKIQIDLQNRTMEYLATTTGAAIPTGATVTVVGVLSPTTLIVESVTEPAPMPLR
jgi:hypothetical protein